MQEKRIDLSLYFDPCPFMDDPDFLEDKTLRWSSQISKYTQLGNFPSTENIKIALIGISENRGEKSGLLCNGADAVRKQLYNLYPPEFLPGIVDLGNLKTGKTIQDTYFALCETITCLLAQKTVVILLGGSQDLTYAMYKAYAKLNQMVNLLNIDSAFDFGDPDVPMKNNSYMGKIIVDPANYLFNYTNIGYQTYMVEGEAISLMSKLYFDAYRYGFFRGEIKEAEPMIRDSDCVTIDLSAIRYSDSPANNYARPTGFTSEDACQMMHYAGLSDQVSTVGLFEYHRLLDSNEQSAKLLAEMIWCFVDGFLHRLNDHPCQNNGMNYKKYMVTLEDSDHELTFYKCKETDRWWMELPCDGRQQEKYNRHRFISCSYKDYQTALSNETPERWWAAYQRLK